MKKIILLFYLFINSFLYSQFDLSAGMGLNFFSSPEMKDYVNSSFETSEEISTFNTSADFFAELDYNLSNSYQLGVEYTYNIYSFNSNYLNGRYDLALNQHKPSIVGYYVYAGQGYKFKFGGGIGLRIAQVKEELYGTISDYSATGFGLLLKAQGDTKLGGDFYALIAGEVRYDLPGEIETLSDATFNVNSFGIALKLGTVYYF